MAATVIYPAHNDMYFIPFGTEKSMKYKSNLKKLKRDLNNNKPIAKPAVFELCKSVSSDLVTTKKTAETTDEVAENLKPTKIKIKKSISTSALTPVKPDTTKDQVELIQRRMREMKLHKPEWTKLAATKSTESIEAAKCKEKEDSDITEEEELLSIHKKAHKISQEVVTVRCQAPDPIAMVHGELPATPRDIATIEIAQPKPKTTKVPPLRLEQLEKIKAENPMPSPESLDRSKYLINFISPRTAFTPKAKSTTPRIAKS